MATLQAILAFLGTLAGLVAVALNRRYQALDQRDADISQAHRELQASLASKKFDDAAFWANRLNYLKALPAKSTPAPQPSQEKTP